MGTRWPRRFLRCFYCGQRSTIHFQGQKSFHCPKCDATNWLDQDGEITDPPAADESLERSTLRYAIPRSSATRSPSPVGHATAGALGDSIFCATCLRNQQMLSSSLAQFEWPDDPSGAEQSARERKYWALRKTLEKRYPQVCGVCLPRVNKRLHQASYTAQTDHLRRMMDLTRSRRKAVRRYGPLDFVDFIGKLSWHASFMLQAVWHIVVVSLLLAELCAFTGSGRWIPVNLLVFDHLRALAPPYSDRLMQWAINLGMCSFPWNPHFKQTIRGFTAHILGFRRWYTYQLLILLERFVALSIAQYSKSQGLPAASQLSAQIIIMLLTVYIYLTARQSVRTDTTPLFRRPTELAAGLHPEVDDRSSTRDPDDLGDILDDILHSPAPTQEQAARISPQQLPFAVPSPGIRNKGDSRSSAFPIPHTTRRAYETNQSFREEPTVAQYNDEMDWSPSASQHRAFSSYNPYKVKNTNPRFSDAPTEPKPGPIWYKVPPAPTNPAQRSRNPPMRPIIRESPKEKKESFFQPAVGRRPVDFGSGARDDSPGLNLAAPKFYAPQPADDPRDSLSNMFAKSFTISPSPEEPEERSKWRPDIAELPGPGTMLDRTVTRIVELVALVAALCGWVFALRSQEHYGRSVALASICVCLIVSIRLAADLEVDYKIRGHIRPSVFAPSLANLALFQLILVILFMWNIWSGGASWAASGVYGNTLFGSIIIHHVWQTFA
ncbi:hypothetical protein SAMD00023353_1301970 [Rosellinia necatrix]|uniref:Ima1 N-terminal domain-containing protein n=1 Tax=Rosellinia necatrix TaxID=77044 RepID=A0A1W2TC64_ROSNE|nr:hypothetical protein SAMD00023353_1301970 [Rosellinia necatrix]